MREADKLIAASQRAINSIQASIRDDLASMTLDELRSYGDRLNAEPYSSLLHLLVTRPKDTAMMVAVHYYSEYFRRLEVVGMEANELPQQQENDHE